MAEEGEPGKRSPTCPVLKSQSSWIVTAEEGEHGKLCLPVQFWRAKVFYKVTAEEGEPGEGWAGGGDEGEGGHVQLVHVLQVEEDQPAPALVHQTVHAVAVEVARCAAQKQSQLKEMSAKNAPKTSFVKKNIW